MFHAFSVIAAAAVLGIAPARAAKPEKLFPEFKTAMLSGLLQPSSSRSGNVTLSAGVDFTQYSGTGIKVAMVDCRDGHVLWSDSDFEPKSIEQDDLEKLALHILKRFP